jgi:PAS domain S-box-containing protein
MPDRSKSEQEYRTIIQASMDSFWKIGADGRIIDCNEAACAMLGYSRDEMLSLSLHEVDLIEDEAKAAEHVRLVIAQGHDRFETQHRRKDGRSVDVEVSAYCVPGAEAPLLFAFSRDISARKAADKALRESEERYRAVVEEQTEVIVRFRPDGTLTFVNAVACRISGRVAAELVGSPWQTLVHPIDLQPLVLPDDLPMIEARLRELTPDNPAVMFDVRLRMGDGQLGLVQFANRAFFDDAGKVAEIQSVGRDITERKQVEEALIESEARTRSILRAAPAGIGMIVDRVFLEVNQAMTIMTGFTPEELIGRSSRMLYPTDEDFDYVGQEKYAQIRRQGVGRVETRWRTKDGRIIDVDLSSSPIVPEDLTLGVTFTAQDITAIKQMEQERLAHEARQRNALVREVHHRIKNHLQGVLGLMRNAMIEKPEIAGAMEGIVARIRLIAQVYGLQGLDRNQQVRLVDLMQSAAEGAMGCVPVKCEFPTTRQYFMLAQEEAVPMALLINELITNAVKHLDAPDPQRPVRASIEVSENEVLVRVRNGPAFLPAGFDYAAGKGIGTGLELLRSLLPPKGAQLEFRQEADEVVAILSLGAPVVFRPSSIAR